MEWENTHHYTFHDQPEEISFRDTQVVHSGKTSIRFENLIANIHGHGRLLKEMEVTPDRLCRASIWFKSENIHGNLLLQIYDQNGDIVASAKPSCPADGTMDWTETSIIFRTPKDGKVRIYARTLESKSGRFWLDDLSVESMMAKRRSSITITHRSSVRRKSEPEVLLDVYCTTSVNTLRYNRIAKSFTKKAFLQEMRKFFEFFTDYHSPSIAMRTGFPSLTVAKAISITGLHVPHTPVYLNH